MVIDQFKVPGMSCQHCVNSISKEVGAVPGVKTVQVVLDTKTVRVEHENTVSVDSLVAAINEAGFDEVGVLA